MSGESARIARRREDAPVLRLLRTEASKRPQGLDGCLIKPERLRELADAGLGLHIYQSHDGIKVDRVPVSRFGVYGAGSG